MVKTLNILSFVYASLLIIILVEVFSLIKEENLIVPWIMVFSLIYGFIAGFFFGCVIRKTKGDD